MQKASFFAAALSDRSFRASPSSLKRDVNNSIQGSNAEFANGTVAQRSGGAHMHTADANDHKVFSHVNLGDPGPSTFATNLLHLKH